MEERRKMWKSVENQVATGKSRSNRDVVDQGKEHVCFEYRETRAVLKTDD